MADEFTSWDQQNPPPAPADNPPATDQPTADQPATDQAAAPSEATDEVRNLALDGATLDAEQVGTLNLGERMATGNLSLADDRERVQANLGGTDDELELHERLKDEAAELRALNEQRILDQMRRAQGLE